MNAKLLIAAASIWLASFSNAQIHKCETADGNVVFSDLPCSQNAEIVKLKEPAGTYSNASEEIDTALRIVSGSRERAEEERSKEQQAVVEARAHQAECAKQEAYLKRLSAGGFFYRDGDPEKGALSDVELAEEIAETRSAYERNCGA